MNQQYRCNTVSEENLLGKISFYFPSFLSSSNIETAYDIKNYCVCLVANNEDVLAKARLNLRKASMRSA